MSAAVGIDLGATAIAIDAPAMPSTNPHGADEDPPPKFRPPRCCEVASLKVAGIPAVSWITALVGAEVSGWMQTGFRVWKTSSSNAPMEVYPYACFYRLNGGKAPVSKQGAEGRLRRVELLRQHLELPIGVDVWSQRTTTIRCWTTPRGWPPLKQPRLSTA